MVQDMGKSCETVVRCDRGVGGRGGTAAQISSQLHLVCYGDGQAKKVGQTGFSTGYGVC